MAKDEKVSAGSGGDRASEPGGDTATRGRGDARRVRVLRDNVGPQLHQKGAITDDPDIVALLRHPTKHVLVEAVE